MHCPVDCLEVHRLLRPALVQLRHLARRVLEVEAHNLAQEVRAVQREQLIELGVQEALRVLMSGLMLPHRGSTVQGLTC